MVQVGSEPRIRDGIGGTVVDTTSLQVPAVSVTLISARTHATREMKTGADGRYFFERLEDGEYQLTFQVQGFLTQTFKGIHYSYPGEYTVDVKMVVGVQGQETSTGYFLIVRVLDSATNKPVENARIQLKEIIEHVVLTDKCGRSWRILSPGTYRLRVEKEGYFSRELKVTIGNTRVSLDVLLKAEKL